MEEKKLTNAEIQHYTSEIEGLELELSQSYKVIEKQKVEIERLKRKAAFYYKKCKSYGIECFCDDELDGVEVE